MSPDPVDLSVRDHVPARHYFVTVPEFARSDREVRCEEVCTFQEAVVDAVNTMLVHD
jgi:hypothetical protein